MDKGFQFFGFLDKPSKSADFLSIVEEFVIVLTLKIQVLCCALKEKVQTWKKQKER